MRYKVLGCLLAFSILLAFAAYAFPSFWIVPWVKTKFDQENYYGLYLSFGAPKTVSFVGGQGTPQASDFQPLRVHNMEFLFPNSEEIKIEKIKDDVDWYRVSIGSRSLLIMGEMPSTVKSLGEEGSVLSVSNNNVVDTNREFVREMLTTTPNDFHLSMDDPLTRFALLNLKVSAVPRKAKQGFILRGGIDGYQAGDPSDGDRIVFVHIVDDRDTWYQLIFSGFTSKQIDDRLALIREL